MTFETDTLAKSAFKVLRGKAHTSDAKDLVNESEVSGPSVFSQQIMATTVSPNPISAMSSSSVAFASIPLVLDSSSNGKAYLATITGSVPASLSGKVNPYVGSIYATGQRVGYFIPESIGSGYRAILKDTGVEVAPLATQDWFFDYLSGVISSEDNLSLSSGTIDGYVYTGEFASTVLNRLDGYSTWIRLGNDGYFAPSGNVGIGTSAPSEKLHVLKAQNAHTAILVANSNSGASAAAEIKLTGSAGTVDLFTTTAGFSPSGVKAASQGIISTTLATGLLLEASTSGSRVDLSAGTSSAVVSVKDGYMGFGTTTPSEAIHIRSSSPGGATLKLDFNDTSWTVGDVIGKIDFSGNDASSGASGIRSSVRAFATSTSGATELVFFTTGSGNTLQNEVLRLGSAGRVGVGGVASPSTALHVVDASNGASIRIQSNQAASSSGTTASSIQFAGFDGSSTNVRAIISAVFEDTVGTTGIRFATSLSGGATTTKMSLGSDGSLGLGRSSPANFLSLATDGSVSAPALSIGSTEDSNTGIFHPSADVLAIAAGGVEPMRLTSTKTQISVLGSDTAPSLAFGSTGTIPGFFRPASGTLAVTTGASEVMRWSSTTTLVSVDNIEFASGSGFQYNRTFDRVDFNIGSFSKAQVNSMGIAFSSKSQTLGGSVTLTPNASFIILTHSSGGTITLADGTTTGQFTILYFNSVTGTVTYPDNVANNMRLASDFVATAGDTLTLVWNGTNWIEVARSVN